ncbi:MAG: hypothetical protein COA33_006430 [Fluviicola sp.]|nr:hypothetical protein [Fluviicola sp.]
MKLALLFLASVFLSLTSFSQEDAVEQEDSQRQREDTIYITPTQEKIDIAILTAPEGFEVSESFNGYIDFQNGTAIVMSLLTSVNYIKLDEGMTDEFFKSNRLTLTSKEKIKTDEGTSGMRYTASFVLEEEEFIRQIVYIGNLNNTIWINITYPKKVQELMEPELVKAIASVKFKINKDENK